MLCVMMKEDGGRSGFILILIYGYVSVVIFNRLKWWKVYHIFIFYEKVQNVCTKRLGK